MNVHVKPTQPNAAPNVSLYDFKGHQVRVVEIDGAPWFAVADIRSILGIRQGGTNLLHLNASEKRVVRKSGSTTFKGHGLSVVSEAGQYKLVMRSDKPEAREFQDWVAGVVLPSIRKDGGYVLGEEKVATGTKGVWPLVQS